MRYALVMVAALGMSGCHGNQAATYNPFAPAGPALMPPPATGTAGRQDPYNRPVAPAGSPGYTSPPGYTPPPGYAPSPGYAPPTGAAPYTPPPTMGTPLGQAAPTGASPYTRFTSQDGSAVEIADSRAGYTAPAAAAPAPYAAAPPTTTGVLAPAPAMPGQPAPLSPYVTGTANQLTPAAPPASPAWSGNF